MKKGWLTKRFHEVLDIRNGKNQREVESESGEYPIYGSAGNVMGYATSYICEAGTTIIGRKGNINSPIYAETPFWNVDTAFGLAANEDLDSKFLYYYCLSYDFSAHNRGTTIPSLVKSELLQIPIKLPPLPEQHRIVAILDEAFDSIAAAKANAEQNLKNARELFESHLQTVFTQRDEGWLEKKFEDICVLQRGFDLPTRLRNEGIFPLVSSNGITDRIDLWKVKAPGVVTGRSGTIGKVHYIEEDYWPLNTALYIKEFHGNYEKFIYYFLKQFDLEKYASGAGVPTLNRNDVHCETVWFPNSLAVQNSSVELLDKLSIETQHLESIYQQKITALDELKNALLHKALAGEL